MNPIKLLKSLALAIGLLVAILIIVFAYVAYIGWIVYNNLGVLGALLPALLLIIGLLTYAVYSNI